MFCLRAFGDGLNLNELPQVTEIDPITIQKHLDFLVKWGSVDEKHKISTYGHTILNLHAKTKEFNRTDWVVFLENAVTKEVKRWREYEDLVAHHRG
ncbi:hypothetical protein Hac_0887 [Helicobacter acinonychis str. Sheeba]|uniref:Uncharacterized protein n=1 Tax=Helicobacter acinonychis (strain Sheeba) TaxID=382638 RepID=Q17XF7_HELAH|nr:hypothetical protein Hac_0887 [Helicobacter acinonychis str. Sheeba]